MLDAATLAVKRTLGEHAGYVTGLAFSPDGRQLATAEEAGENESARVFDVATGKVVHVLGGHKFPVRAIAFSADGKRFATAAGDEERVTQPGEVKVWNAADGKLIDSFSNPKRAATGVAFSPDGKFLASTGFDERVILYDLAKGKAVSFFAGHSRPTNAVLFARGGAVVISASGGRAKGNNEVKIWERDSGTELTVMAVHSARVDAIALSADQSLLATGGYDKRVTVWDVKNLLKKETPPPPKQTAANDAKSPALAPAVQKTSTPASVKKDGQKGPVRVGITSGSTRHIVPLSRRFRMTPTPSPTWLAFAWSPPTRGECATSRRAPNEFPNTRRIFVSGEWRSSIPFRPCCPKSMSCCWRPTTAVRILDQALAVIKAGKPLFIDKPIAASLADAIAIFELARRYHVPVFSSSSLRFAKSTLEARNGKIGTVQTCETTSPCHLEKTHPDLFWYGIHGVESLFTVMGTGCKSVRRTVSTPTEDVVVGQWEGGRVGTFRGTRGKGGYGGTATGTKGTMAVGAYDGYRPLVVAIVHFFYTGVAPVKEEETLENLRLHGGGRRKQTPARRKSRWPADATARAEAEKRLRQLP